MKEIRVQKMPYNVQKILQANGCTRPKHCFANCAIAVSNLNVGEAYVLCFVELPGNEKLGHALIKVEGNYHDPTLEPQRIDNARYWLHSEFSQLELRKFVKDWHNNLKANAYGRAVVHPPALRSDGTIACEEILA